MSSRLPYRQVYFNFNDVRAWWATRFASGGYLIHSIIYKRVPGQIVEPADYPTEVFDGRLGVDASYGCVRLATENAKWVYNNIPEKTRCVVY